MKWQSVCRTLNLQGWLWVLFSSGRLELWNLLGYLDWSWTPHSSEGPPPQFRGPPPQFRGRQITFDLELYSAPPGLFLKTCRQTYSNKDKEKPPNPLLLRPLRPIDFSTLLCETLNRRWSAPNQWYHETWFILMDGIGPNIMLSTLSQDSALVPRSSCSKNHETTPRQQPLFSWRSLEERPPGSSIFVEFLLSWWLWECPRKATWKNSRSNGHLAGVRPLGGIQNTQDSRGKNTWFMNEAWMIHGCFMNDSWIIMFVCLSVCLCCLSVCRSVRSVCVFVCRVCVFVCVFVCLFVLFVCLFVCFVLFCFVLFCFVCLFVIFCLEIHALHPLRTPWWYWSDCGC